MNHKRYLFKAVTLVELLIVVGIISVVTVAIIPSYVDFVTKREFKNSADQFVGDVKAVQSKAISGVIVNVAGESVLVDWGIQPTCGDDSYSLSYGYDSDSGYVKTDVVTKKLPKDVKFHSDSDKCGDIFFKRNEGSPTTASAPSIRLSYKDLIRDVIVTNAGLVRIELVAE